MCFSVRPPRRTLIPTLFWVRTASFAPLSAGLSKLLHATGVPQAYSRKLQDAHCPMYPDGTEEGSVWIQEGGAIRNPYFGKTMLTCTDWQRPLEVAR